MALHGAVSRLENMYQCMYMIVYYIARLQRIIRYKNYTKDHGHVYLQGMDCGFSRLHPPARRGFDDSQDQRVCRAALLSDQNVSCGRSEPPKLLVQAMCYSLIPLLCKILLRSETFIATRRSTNLALVLHEDASSLILDAHNNTTRQPADSTVHAQLSRQTPREGGSERETQTGKKINRLIGNRREVLRP